MFGQLELSTTLITAVWFLTHVSTLHATIQVPFRWTSVVTRTAGARLYTGVDFQMCRQGGATYVWTRERHFNFLLGPKKNFIFQIHRTRLLKNLKKTALYKFTLFIVPFLSFFSIFSFFLFILGGRGRLPPSFLKRRPCMNCLLHLTRPCESSYAVWGDCSVYSDSHTCCIRMTFHRCASAYVVPRQLCGTHRWSHHVQGNYFFQPCLLGCAFKLEIKLNRLSHILHLYGFSPVGCPSLSFLQTFTSLNVSLHSSHLNGFSPCSFAWFSMSCFCAIITLAASVWLFTEKQELNLNLLLQCSQTYDLSLVCVLIWLARPPFQALRYSHWPHANGFSPHRSHLYGFSPARHLMWWNYSNWNNTSDEGHAHPEPPPQCWPLTFTIPLYKSWIRSWYNCYANIPMLFIVQFTSRRYMSNLFNNSSCFQTFNWWNDSKWKKKQKKVQLMEWLGWITRSTSSAEDPTECTSSRIRNHSMNWKKKKLKWKEWSDHGICRQARSVDRCSSAIQATDVYGEFKCQMEE